MPICLSFDNFALSTIKHGNVPSQRVCETICFMLRLVLRLEIISLTVETETLVETETETIIVGPRLSLFFSWIKVENKTETFLLISKEQIFKNMILVFINAPGFGRNSAAILQICLVPEILIFYKGPVN